MLIKRQPFYPYGHGGCKILSSKNYFSIDAARKFVTVFITIIFNSNQNMTSITKEIDAVTSG